MAHEDSPSSIMYADFKALGLKNRDVALVLLDADRSFGSVTMRDRIGSRSQLSRVVVHVAPGEIDLNLFNDFTQSAQTIMSRIVTKHRTGSAGDVVRMVSERYSGEAAHAMRQLSSRRYSKPA